MNFWTSYVTPGYLMQSTVRVSVILAIALLTVQLLRTRSAALRHWILVTAMAAAVAVPALSLLMPRWSPMPIVTVAQIPTPMITDRSGVVTFQTGPGPSFKPAQLLIGVWAAGALAALSVLLAGAARLGRIADRSKPVFLGNWVTLSTELSGRYGLRRPIRLLLSEHGSFLVTWGGLQPRVLLPADASDWPEDRIRVVLSHELAHVERWDWPIQMMAELLRAAYWFNPLMWLACNRLKRESEQACDDAALSLGIAGTDYATHLLELARILKQSRRTWSPGLAIARQSTLERRFTAMLNPVLDRRKVNRSTLLAIAIAALCVTLPLAALQSTAQAQTQPQASSVSGLSTKISRISGAVSDANGAAVARATVIVSTPDGRTQDIAPTTPTGAFTFAGLPAGQYVLQVFASGFGPSRLTNIEVVAGRDLRQDIKMDIGFVQTVQSNTRSNPSQIATAPGFNVIAPSTRPTQAVVTTSDPGNNVRTFSGTVSGSPSGDPGAATASTSSRIRMGGAVMAGNLIIQTKPAYPPLAKAARIQGVVILEAVIDTEGRVFDLHVISGHPLLQQSAIDAVSTWRYQPIMLNGAPVEVVTTVTVNFSFTE